LKIDCHINKIPKQVRLEVFKLNSSKSKNFVRLCKEKVNHLPRFSIDVICFLMATPTVAKPIYDKKLEKYIPYSSSYNRSLNLLQFSKDTVYFASSGGWALITNICKASMQTQISYYPFILIDLQRSNKEINLESFSKICFMSCTCKNGDSGGNCAHIAALFIKVSQLQDIHGVPKSTIINNVKSVVASTKCAYI